MKLMKTNWKRESLISPLGRFLYWLWLHRPLLLHLHRGLGGSPGRPAGLGWLRHRLLQHWGLGRGFPRGPPGVLPGCPGGVEALRHGVLQHGAVSAGPGPGGSRGCGRLGHGLVCRVVLLNLLLASASPGLGLTRSLRSIFIRFYHQKRLGVRGDLFLVENFEYNIFPEPSYEIDWTQSGNFYPVSLPQTHVRFVPGNIGSQRLDPWDIWPEYFPFTHKEKGWLKWFIKPGGKREMCPVEVIAKSKLCFVLSHYARYSTRIFNYGEKT